VKSLTTKLFALVIFIFLFSTSTVFAESFSEGVLQLENKIFSFSNGKALILDEDEQNNQILKFVDVSLNKLLWFKKSGKVFDVHLMTNPNKIVVIFEENNFIKKIVYDFNGNIINFDSYNSKFPLPINKENFKLKWLAPYDKVKERILIQNNNEFKVYQNPWRNPVIYFNAKISPSTEYEYISVVDWEFDRYPYLAIKYRGDAIFRNDYFLKVVNLYNKTEYIKEFNTNFDLIIQHQNLFLNTQHNLGPHPPHVSYPDLATEQPFLNNLIFDQVVW
jgi:hypothetical protein